MSNKRNHRRSGQNVRHERSRKPVVITKSKSIVPRRARREVLPGLVRLEQLRAGRRKAIKSVNKRRRESTYETPNFERRHPGESIRSYKRRYTPGYKRRKQRAQRKHREWLRKNRPTDVR